MPSCKPCKKAGLKGETSNELTDMKLIECAPSNRGNTVY